MAYSYDHYAPPAGGGDPAPNRRRRQPDPAPRQMNIAQQGGQGETLPMLSNCHITCKIEEYGPQYFQGTRPAVVAPQSFLPTPSQLMSDASLGFKNQNQSPISLLSSPLNTSHIPNGPTNTTQVQNYVSYPKQKAILSMPAQVKREPDVYSGLQFQSSSPPNSFSPAGSAEMSPLSLIAQHSADQSREQAIRDEANKRSKAKYKAKLEASYNTLFNEVPSWFQQDASTSHASQIERAAAWIRHQKQHISMHCNNPSCCGFN